MGAQFNTLVYDGEQTREQVQTRFAEAQAEDLFENGHSYSGGIGMAQGLRFVTHDVFATGDEADEWLSDNAEKWEAALAVRFKDVDGKELWMIGAWCSS